MAYWAGARGKSQSLDPIRFAEQTAQLSPLSSSAQQFTTPHLSSPHVASGASPCDATKYQQQQHQQHVQPQQQQQSQQMPFQQQQQAHQQQNPAKQQQQQQSNIVSEKERVLLYFVRNCENSHIFLIMFWFGILLATWHLLAPEIFLIS